MTNLTHHDTPQLIKAEKAIITFATGVELEAYRMPNGEFRAGLNSASLLVGYSKDWLGKGILRSDRTAKALQELGFSQQIEEVTATTNVSNFGVKAKTISLDDLSKVILYAAIQGKKEAIALQLSFTKISLNDFFRDAFNERPLTIEEKRHLFYKTYAASLTKQDWLHMDKQDIENLRLGLY
jgi:hypothetical protein